MAIRPDVVGISQWTHNRHASFNLAIRCRKLFPESTIIFGGGHATFCYEDLLLDGSPVDCVVIGEGEQTLLELADQSACRTGWPDIKGLAFRHDGKVLVTPRRSPLTNLDQLPMPAKFFEHSIGLDLGRQSEFIVTARGCPSACHFCSSPAFWGNKVRFRSARAIVEEILYIRDRFGLIYFSIRDDTFTADRRRTLEFCSALIERQANILWNCQSRVTAVDEEMLVMMKKAGCECIQLGVESGSPRILKQLGKDIDPVQVERACGIIRKVGINLSVYLISDIPGETADDLQKTIELVRRIRPDDGYVSPLAYYPGTRLFKDAVASEISDRYIFSDTRENALYVGSKLDQHSSNRLIKELSSDRSNDPARFKRQKEFLGYCYTTNILAGEFYRQREDQKSAENEFQEIISVQPENPWGWFLMGELYSEIGKWREAGKCYREVLEIVPLHEPSRVAVSG